MSRNVWLTLQFLICIILSTACRSAPSTPAPGANLPNPASVYCEQNGGKLELRSDESGSVAGMCVFPDGSECDQWAYSRSECKPGDSLASLEPAPTAESSPTPEPIPPTPAATALPTPLPIDPAGYQGWWTYTSSTYGFTLLLPPDWMVDEATSSDLLLNGHLVNIRPQNSADNVNIRMTFRRTGEEVLLWPTGVGSGELIEHGVLDVAGQPTRRVAFVCPTGQVNAVYYKGEEGPNITRDELEFGFIFSFTGIYCEEGYSLEGKVLRVGEMVIASLTVP